MIGLLPKCSLRSSVGYRISHVLVLSRDAGLDDISRSDSNDAEDAEKYDCQKLGGQV